MEPNNDDWQDPEFDLPLTSPLSYSQQKSEQNNSSLVEPAFNNLHELFSSAAYNRCVSNHECQSLASIIHRNPVLYHQILAVMLCEEDEELSNHLKQYYNQSEITNLPYKCFDLLSSMNDDYWKRLLSVEGKTEQEVEISNEIMKRYFGVFKHGQINETAAGYVLRINETVLMRESSFPLYEWLNSHEDVLGDILKHFDSYSAVALIARLLDLEVESVIIEERTRMIDRIVEKVIDLSILLNKPKLIQGLRMLIDEQFERAMNSENAEVLTNQIVTSQNVTRLLQLLESSHEVTVYVLEIVASILNHYKKEEPKLGKENSRTYTGYRPPPQIYIPTHILKSIIESIPKIYNYVKEQEASNETGFIKKTYFRYMEVLAWIGKYYTESVGSIANVELVNDILESMKKYDRNSLLHVASKDFLLGVVKINREDVVYSPGCKVVEFVFDGLVTKNYYQQHLFEILRALLEDSRFKDQSEKLTVIDYGRVLARYQVMLDSLPKPQAEEEPEEQGDESQVEDLDFDPTQNIDNLSPYYYQEMVIDEDYEKEGQRRGSYGCWKDGKMNAGVLTRNIALDIEEVESPVLYRFGQEGESEKDKERMWGLKMPNLLDSENQDSVLSRKLSNKVKEIQSFEERNQEANDVQTKQIGVNEVLNDQKQQQNMELQRSRGDQSSEEKDKVETTKIQIPKPKEVKEVPISPKINEKEKEKPFLVPIIEQEDQQREVERSSWTGKIAGKIFRPFTWLAEFVWDIS